MENKIYIHEFSTGIEVKGTATAWESGGFTGEYMNRTLDKIPQAVLDSIANREFALAEGVVRAEPAIVGRVVRRGKESWSVVAVVTRGRDDFGRGVSLYRYFLCQGDTGIETILRWMNKPLSWVFNPFDKRAIGEPHQADHSYMEVNLIKFKEMLDQSPPIIFLAAESCTPLLLNEITRKLRRPNGDRSWAYKVAMLERPEYFQVIYPADAKAEMVIREVLDRRQSSSVLISGESGIKTAIKAVMNGRVKRGHIESLENALGNQGLDKNYWKSVLDKEGASQAVTENIYGDRYVRLLTLKAMLVPQFLPEFLAWLAHSQEGEIHYGTSLKLQQSMLQEAPKFTEHFPRLSEYLKWGICYTIDDLVDEPKIIKQSQFLLTKPGFWGQLYKESLSKELENVLDLMGEKRHNLESLNSLYPQWSSLLGKINKFWYPQERPDNKYKSLAELFEKLETAKLAAIFYQIAEGSVPKNLFDSILPSDKKSESTRLFNKKIDRKKSVGDHISSVFNDVQTTFLLSRRTAIQKLMNNSVKWEYLTTLDNALDNSTENQLNDNESWESFFDKQGAKGALDKNSYSKRIIKLLTLKAILIPHFLPLFLEWLRKSEESEKHYSVSQNLQEEILGKVPELTQNCPKLSEQLKWGICIVIHSLVNYPHILKESKLLLTKPGLWSEVYQESLSGELENDINLISAYISGRRDLPFQAVQYPEWEELLRDIMKFSPRGQQADSRYWTLGNLFEAVETPKLAQVFYGIGGNEAPTSIMPSKKAQKSKGIVKICWDFLFEKIDMGDRMRRIFILLVFFASVSFAGYSGWFLRGILQPNGSASKRNENYQAINALIDDLTKETKNIFDQSKKNNQDDKLPKKIIASIKQKKLNKPEEILPFCIGDILEIKDFQYSDIKADNQKSLKFSEAISKYQDQKGIKNAAPGIIKRDKNTYKQLKIDIENECLSPRLSEINQDKYDKTNAAIEAIAKGLEIKIKDLVSNKSLPTDIPAIFYKDYYQEQNPNPQNINSQGIVQHCVKKELGLGSDFQYSYIRQYNKEWEKFSETIKKYQREKGTMTAPDGVINQEKDTQKTLKENIQKKCLKSTTVESLNLKNPKPPST
ncbi:MAG: hypothetical protein J7F05_09315 [Trichodesmium erythraeum GBRTRLIN201]|nr:hypothetical protein [Trichodesmium erythraeum GBRTRLIN201]